MADVSRRIADLSPDRLQRLIDRLQGKSPGRQERRISPRPPGLAPVPTSFAQERLWFLEQLEPGTALYNVTAGLRLRGRLDFPALVAALHELVARHESLRTTFAEIEGQPCQIIAPAASAGLPRIDLSALPGTLREAELGRLAKGEARRPFDLVHGPLLRASLVRLSGDDHAFVCVLHHIVSDGWSSEVLVRELSALYAAFSAGWLSPLPPLPIQYADYAVWQREHLSGETLAARLAYWRERLADLPPLELPTDRPRPAVATFRGGRLPVPVPRHAAAGIQELARKSGASLFMALLAVFEELLHRYTHQEDFGVGTPVANRDRNELHGLIGFFVNSVVMRSEVSGDPSFSRLLGRIRETTLAAYSHQDLPFEKLVEELRPRRDLSRSPLFQVMLALHNTPAEPLALPELTLAPLPLDSGAAKFELLLSLAEAGEDLEGGIEYNADLFDAATIERLTGHYASLLAGVVATPARRLSELPMLSEAERLELRAFNDTGGPGPASCLHEIFEAQAARTPESVALVHGTRRWTYRELDRQAGLLARLLARMGVGPEVRVAVCLERTADLPTALLAVLKAGGAYVPLDPVHPRERLQFLIEDSGAAVLLTRRGLVPRLEGRIPTLATDGEEAGGADLERPASRVSPGHLAYVLYTSGSTGRPKGVAVEHRSAAALLHWASRTFSAEELAGVLAATSAGFDLSVFEMFAPWAMGGTVILAANALELPELPAAGEVTLVNTVPSAIAALARQGGIPPSVRTVNLAGEPLRAALAREVYANSRAERIWNLYGPTEDTTYSTGAPVGRDDAREPAIGRPLPGTRAHVLDPFGQEVPVGVPGELYLAGAGLARGYLGRPDLTAERFGPDPFSIEPGARLYRTGDLVRCRPGGDLDYLGRLDYQVKIRGFRIELGEIEAQLTSHPEVREAVVMAHELAPGDKSLVAYAAAPEQLAPARLREWLRERLPEPLVPPLIVRLDSLPKTPNGKVDRKALPAPDRSAGIGLTAPRSPSEEILADLWAEVLGCGPVGIHDSFFDLGGHSLLATRVVARVRGLFGVELPLRTLFERPSVAELATAVEELRGVAESLSAAPPLVPLPRTEDLPLSFAQERLWFLDRLQPLSPFYNLPLALELRGPISLPALGASIDAIVARHEALRTTFSRVQGRPVQNILPALRVALPRIDLDGLPEPLREAKARRLAREEAARPFDLAQGPLLRAQILRLEGERHLAVLNLHHIVADGWSLGLLLQELSALYAALSAGERPALPALPVQYADFAVWQRRWLTGEALESRIRWWRRRLAGAPHVLDLPTDRPRPAVQSLRGAVRGFTLPPGLTAALRELSRRQGATLFMTLASLTAALLSRYSGAEDLLLGAPVAGRNRTETERLIGLFVNTLVLRAELAGDPPFSTALCRMREMTFGAYDHQDLPLEKLVDSLQPERNLAHTPLFQVLLVLQNTSPGSLELPGLATEPVPVESGTARFDLVLTFNEADGGLRGSLEHNRDLFDPTTAARLTGHLRSLAEGAAGRPEARLSELPLLSAPEAHQLRGEWNDTAVPRPPGALLHELFSLQTAAAPDAPALVFEGRTLTYAELDRRAERLAVRLRGLGVGPDVAVGLLLERSFEMVVALLGTLKAGGGYLPLDPEHPGERLAGMVADAEVLVLLAQERLLPVLPAIGAQIVLLEEGWDGSGTGDGEAELREISDESLAYVLYTSGSTGRPKGVMIPHRGIVNRLLWMQEVYGLSPADRVLQKTPYSFDVSVWEFFWPLITGACLVIARPGGHRDAAYLAGLIERERVTVTHFVPSMLQAFLAHPDLSGCAGLRLVVASGEALSPELRRRCRERLPARLENLYGPTEASVDVTAWNCSEVAGNGAVPIGRPVANTAIHLLDRSFRPVPIGVAGELCIGGVQLARGYWRRPDLTAERFVPDPCGPAGGRLYRTGDLARHLPDGAVEFLGRIDHQVKIRGFRIELGEVEAALAGHPQIRDVVVVAREMAGFQGLVAYLVCESGPPTMREFREHLRQRLPEHMIPAAFVPLPELPRTPSGKIDRRALPRPDRPAAPATGREVPRSEVERRIAAIWRDLLAAGEIGSDDNFFDLGGHSLLLAQVQSRLASDLGLGVEMVDLFAHPTVRSLARFLARDADEALPEALPPRSSSAERSGAIAVIGMAGRFPRSGNLDQLWRNLCDGVEMISFFSEEEMIAAGVSREELADPAFVRAAGVLEGADLFDAELFGVPPREAEIIDPQQRLLLECAWEALEQAGYAGTRLRVGAFAGTSLNTYLLHNVLSRPDIVGGANVLALATASAPDYAATRLSYKLGLSGPGVTVQTACSTSLTAIHLACQSLLAGDCEIALAGGASVSSNPVSGYRYQPGGTLSPDGHCRAFDTRAQGTVGGQGVGMVVLKRLDDALAAGDTIRAVILGSAISNDGSSRAGFTAPSPEGQAAAIRDAHRRAGVDPASIGYVEAHGTGTPLGDPIEVAALNRAFGPDLAPASCALGSIKTNIGHLDAAAGVAGFVKAVLAVERGAIPPSLHFEEPNLEIDFGSGPFHINTGLAPWPEERRPRRAGVSSFGLGGTNVHAVLEEPPPAGESGPSRPWHLLTLSARSAGALETATDALATALAAMPERSLADIAYTLWTGRRAFGERRAALARSPEEAAAALASRDPRRTWTVTDATGDRPVAFVLPGVGEQYPGMAAGLYAAEPVFRREIDLCAERLLPHLGLDLRELIAAAAPSAVEPGLRSLLRPRAESEGPLHRTEIAQPAMFAVGWALARLWMSWGLRPTALLGYSLGEYTAACLAGVMSLEDGLALVAHRARLIAALPPAGMLAVPLPEDELLPRLSPGLSVAAVNGPSVCMVAGPLTEVVALEERLTRDGLPCRRLRTSHAFHSPIMEPVAGPLRDLLRGIELRPPQVPYLSNVTGTWIEPGQAVDPDYWAAHLLGTVRFADSVAELWREPRRVLLELGPGSSLGSLALQQLPDEPGDRMALPSLRHELERQDDQALLFSTLARLWTAGVEIDAELLYAGERRRRVPLPTYPFERRRFWLERGRAVPAPAEPAGKIPDPADWFHVPTWRLAAPAGPPRRTAPRRWLVLFDELGLGERLTARLQAAGHEVAGIRPGSGPDLERLLAGMAQAPEEIVHAWSLTAQPAPSAAEDRFDAAQESGFYSLIAITRALARRFPGRKIRLSVLVNGLCRVERSDLLQPEKATLLGPLQVIPQEHPEIACRAFDVDPGETGDGLEERLLAELAREDGEPLQALRGPHRWIPDFTPVRLEADPEAPLPLRERGVYLITGGLGGLGLALAGWLARTQRARLALVGRTPLPERASPSDPDETVRRLREIDALRTAGADVLVLTADVADETAMCQAVDRIRQRFGRIDGVFHVAGVPGGGLVQLKSREDAARVLAPKARGALVLESVLRDDPPSLVVYFSSISAVSGGIGQVDYCAAHTFLDAFASQRAARGERTVTVNWCEWQWDRWTATRTTDLRVLAELRRQREVYGLSFDEGLEALRRVLASGLPRAVVSTRGLRRELDHSHSLGTVLDELAKLPERPAGQGRQRPRTGAPYEGPRNATEERIARVWQELFGFEPIGIHDNFFQLGGSSLLGLEVAWRLNPELGIEVPLQALFEAPTVAELAVLLAPGEVPPATPAPAIRVRPREEDLLARLDDLSDEEMEHLLATMTAEEEEGVQP